MTYARCLAGDVILFVCAFARLFFGSCVYHIRVPFVLGEAKVSKNSQSAHFGRENESLMEIVE